jgi:hypothetical protein
MRLDQVRIADLLAHPHRHRRDLGVEQRVGRLAGEIVDDLEVLAAGVEDLEHILIVDQQVEQGLQVDALALGSIAAASLVGDLDEAELRPIGAFAHELRVDATKGDLARRAQSAARVALSVIKRMNVHGFVHS